MQKFPATLRMFPIKHCQFTTTLTKMLRWTLHFFLTGFIPACASSTKTPEISNLRIVTVQSHAYALFVSQNGASRLCFFDLAQLFSSSQYIRVSYIDKEEGIAEYYCRS